MSQLLLTVGVHLPCADGAFLQLEVLAVDPGEYSA